MKKVLELFVKVGEKPGTVEVPKEAPIQQVSQPVPVQQQPIIATGGGQEDQKIKEQLAAALEAANLEGYDYFEFARSVDAQAALFPSESLRYTATFTAVAAVPNMKVTVDTLVSSAEHYLSVLAKKEEEFKQALDQQTGSSVTAKEGSITAIDQNMASKAEQIQKITEEINNLQQQKTALQNEIGSAKLKIEQVKNNFYATLKLFTDKISSDINKIKTYLGGTKK